MLLTPACAYRSRIPAISASLWQTHVRWGTGSNDVVPLDAHDKIMSQLSRRATRTVSDADEMRLIGFQFTNGSIETFHASGTLWRKKFKRKCRPRGSENVLSVHRKATEKDLVASRTSPGLEPPGRCQDGPC